MAEEEEDGWRLLARPVLQRIDDVEEEGTPRMAHKDRGIADERILPPLLLLLLLLLVLLAEGQAGGLCVAADDSSGHLPGSLSDERGPSPVGFDEVPDPTERDTETREGGEGR